METDSTFIELKLYKTDSSGPTGDVLDKSGRLDFLKSTLAKDGKIKLKLRVRPGMEEDIAYEVARDISAAGLDCLRTVHSLKVFQGDNSGLPIAEFSAEDLGVKDYSDWPTPPGEAC